MPVQPHAAPVSRWGDAVYQIALLIADDRQHAAQLTVEAFRRARRSDPTGAQAETTLFSALLSQARPRRTGVRLPGRKHELPQDWAELPVVERALLGLWLMRDVDGRQLAALAHLEPDALAARLGAALAPVLDAPAGDDFNEWLSAKLGLSKSVPAYALAAPLRDARAAYQRRLDELTASLRDAVGKSHLPAACAETIEAGDDETGGAWRRSPLWVGAVIVGVIACLVLVVAPWRGNRAPASGTGAASDTPAALVQQAIDSWGIQPVDGTRHQRVWALDDDVARRVRSQPGAQQDAQPRQAQITDVWIDPSGGGFRWEVTRNKETVEWILSDGSERLEYAVDQSYSACEWIDLGAGKAVRRFEVPADTQRQVLDARLRLGSYGAGYTALRRALEAGDLRSYGRRVEGTTQLIALGYTAPDQRSILLLFDAQDRQLRAVREVAAQGSQAQARDLWRLEADETLEQLLPRSRPQWVSGRDLTTAPLLDPACPELSADRIVSLRSLTGRAFWLAQPYVPRELPPGIDKMLLYSPTPLTPGSGSAQDLRLLMVGPERWMRLRFSQSSIPSDSRSVGPWNLSMADADGVTYGTLCLAAQEDSIASYCWTSLDLTAAGWSEQDILTTIELLTAVQASSWPALDELFVDPRPLAPELDQLLERAVAGALPPQDGVMLSVSQRETRVQPDRPVWQDPYHVPLDVLQPSSIQQRQWLSFEGGTLLARRSEQTLPDGTLLALDSSADDKVASYRLASSELAIMPESAMWSWSQFEHPAALELVLPLLESTAPITVSNDPEGVVLRQAADEALQQTPMWSSQLSPLTPGLHLTPWTGGLSGRIERRVWLDPATSRPRLSRLVLIDAAGNETLLSQTRIVEQSADARMPEGLWDAAALSPDTIVTDSSAVDRTTTLRNGQGFQLPGRVLVLPDAELSYVRPYVLDSVDLEVALHADIWQVDQFGVTDVRRYRLPDVEPLLVVRQGPSTILAHTLRISSRVGVEEWSRLRSSEAFTVTVDGAQRTAWLIVDGAPTLVVDLDGVLVTLSGPDEATLRGPVVEALGRMTWQ